MFFRGLVRTTAAQAAFSPAAASSRALVRPSPLAKTSIRRAGSTGPEPAGYAFGETPAQRRKWYSWEAPWYIGMYGGTLVWLIAMYYSPNLSPKQAAKIEAHKRLAERGETFGWPLPANYRVYAPGEERQPVYNV
ncbi:hypothetical protein HK097_004949 [Rhizophlyctis rosea]|uniref:NADH-ubiquinone oxidoreductase ESSS subunit n=1 Tax=Rhizophlyctis rosea TaxID=64517 RepID=A0AAD5SLP3_9FUNG|nr:hypothetical protein HK097_004949 [Rhizophlyctis rosea]